MAFRRLALSACMYAVGETVGHFARDEDSIDIWRCIQAISIGAFADVFLLRRFHFLVEKKLPRPILRTIAEQLIYSPFSNAGYLTIARGVTWTFDDWTRIYMRDLSFWPVASFIGYRFVPVRSRYLYVSFASLVWNSWRSSLV